MRYGITVSSMVHGLYPIQSMGRTMLRKPNLKSVHIFQLCYQKSKIAVGTVCLYNGWFHNVLAMGKALLKVFSCKTLLVKELTVFVSTTTKKKIC